MSAIWTWFVGTKVGRWLVGVMLVLAGLVAALFVAFVKGEKTGAAKGEADAAQAEAKAAQQQAAVAASDQQAQQAAQQAASEVQNEVSQLPDAPAQTVGDAAAGTAAGELDAGGWVRAGPPRHDGQG